MALLAVFAAVVIGIALFSLCRAASGRILTSVAAALIGIVLFLSPIIAAVFVGPITLSQVSFLSMSIATPFLTGLIALAAGLICLQAIIDQKKDQTKSSWPQTAFFGAAALAFVSLLWQWLAVAHGRPLYLDAMMQGWAYLASLAALLWVIPQVASSRPVLYALMLCLIGGAGIASGIGTQDFLLQLRMHVADPRENATSINPDFFACFLITTLLVSLALWLGAPAGSGKQVGLLYALAFVLQVVVLPLTQSRFALIAAPIGFLVFIGAYLFARRRGMPAVAAVKGRLLALAVILLVGAVIGSRSILHRFEAGTWKAQLHSGEFRIWTWKGEAKLIEDHPILGTGPGTFDYAYPRYALVGFAQHAHNSFMQIAGDIGIPGLLFVLAAFGGALFLGVKALDAPARSTEETKPEAATATKKKSRKAEPAPTQEALGDRFLDQVAPPDDRWVLAGLLGGLAAGLVQNLIDSDLYLFFNGVTIVAFAGFIFAIAQSQSVPSVASPRRALLAIGAAVCAVVAGGMFWNGVATSYAASGDYQTAQNMEPLNGTYASLLGWRVYLPQGRVQDAEEMLKRATELAPDGVCLNHLGDYYLYAKKPETAIATFDKGLRYDPNSLELLLKAAQTEESLGRHEDALRYYGKMYVLQQGPYAHILAITEVTEYRYAYADTVIGDQSMAQRNFPNAVAAYQSAQIVLQSYANGGGSRNAYRMIENGGKADPDLDQGLQQLYEHVMSQMESVDEQSGKPNQAAGLRAKAAQIIPKFSS